jgi:hypothetical protein
LTPFQKKEKKQKQKEKKKKWIIHFSISGSSQHASIFTTGCHLRPTSLLSLLAAFVILHHRPPFPIFQTQASRIFHHEF